MSRKIHFKDLEIGGIKLRAEYFEHENISHFWEPKHKNKLDKLWDDLTFPIYRIKNKMRDLWWEIIYGFQRMFRGYDNVDTFSIDSRFIERYKRILTEFRKFSWGNPGIMSEEEWKSIIDKMIFHLQYMDEDTVLDELLKEVPDVWVASQKSIDEVVIPHKDAFFELFSKYFYHLWD